VIGTSRLSRIALAAWTALVLLFLFVPIAIIVVYAFNSSNVQSWPLPGLSTKWFSSTWHNAEMRQALWLSVARGADLDGDRTRARLDGRIRGASLPLLRARSDLLPAGAADRAAGNHHRHGAQLLHQLQRA